MTDRALLQQALEALEKHAMQRTYAGGVYIANVAIALRDRLAQPEQEPVCAHGVVKNKCDFCKQSVQELICVCGAIWEGQELVSTPPQRTWVGLTDDEIALICGECAASAHKTDDISYARAIEAKLKEKNNE